MAPESVSSEKRNVGSVPHAVVRIAENPLPGRFCPSLASAAYDVGCERRSGGASTGATATGHGGLKEGPEERVVAKTCGAVGWVVANVRREECAGAGVIPGNFRNVGKDRTECGSVAGIPVGGIGAGVGVAEIRTTDSNVVRRGSESVDRDAVSCFGNTIVATGRAAVTGSDKNRYAFGNGLLIGRIVSGVGGCSVHGFALAIADAHDGRRRSGGVDEVLDGD